ncbi:Choline-glycine betaine transporter [Gracilibacillus ureilyticus]|uniref:Choline-glycine betaine transporter n=1 Tax=Gracilibacillus ureilyticus TaxID=531814 RepID=A0A1H9V9L3_9BACI|nr:BCCT family transporter [Gracilibacillus ureilyticus]SES17943.1 Choline-glycine betaine transporter [Gracilibacillus ureilyticus]
MEDQKKKKRLDWIGLVISGGLLVLFVIATRLNKGLVDQLISDSFSFTVKYFGAYWQVLLLVMFVIGLILAFSKYGKVRLGKIERPENSNFRWIAMILCTLLASGGVFWAAAGPMYHFLTTPPQFSGVESGSMESAYPAMAQSYLHWGFSAWASLGTLTTIVLMYAHYHKDQPLKPRTLLYPMFGRKINKKSFIGSLADIVSIVAAAAGTIGPIGFLGLQVGYGLQQVFGFSNTFLTQSLIILFLAVIASISAATGVERGIQWLSRINVGLVVVLMVIMLILGPTMFIIDLFIGSEAFYIQNFLTMSLYRLDEAWLGAWIIFFWGWFIGYGPMMAIFISRISRGRTIRELIIAVSLIAPIVSNFWFTVVGGSGIFYEMEKPGSVSTALNESGMPAAVMAILNQIPMGIVLAIGFIIVSVIFVATTADSMSYTVAVTLSGSDEPDRFNRVFWALMFGIVAVALLAIGGESTVGTLQNFIVVTAAPVSLLLLPSLWDAPRIAARMAKEQNIVEKK